MWYVLILFFGFFIILYVFLLLFFLEFFGFLSDLFWIGGGGGVVEVVVDLLFLGFKMLIIFVVLGVSFLIVEKNRIYFNFLLFLVLKKNG